MSMEDLIRVCRICLWVVNRTYLKLRSKESVVVKDLILSENVTVSTPHSAAKKMSKVNIHLPLPAVRIMLTEIESEHPLST